MGSVSRLDWRLLLLALAGAVASLIGPPESWWGIDIGSAGATLFGFTLVFLSLIVANFARFLWALGQGAEPPQQLRLLPAGHLMWNLFVLLVSWVVVSHTIRGSEPDVVERDERDLRFQRAANRVGDFALSAIVIGCLVSRYAWERR